MPTTLRPGPIRTRETTNPESPETSPDAQQPQDLACNSINGLVRGIVLDFWEVISGLPGSAETRPLRAGKTARA